MTSPAFETPTTSLFPTQESSISVKVEAVAEGIVAEFAADRSRLLDIVEAVERRSGYVSKEAIQAIARGLSIHPVEVEDMLSFYAFFDRQPRGRNRIRLSKTPVSFMKGAKEVARALEEAIGISVGGTSADGAFTLQWTSDIGMADQEPAALVNGMILTGLTSGDVPQIVTALRQEKIPPKAKVRSSLVQHLVRRFLSYAAKRMAKGSAIMHRRNGSVCPAAIPSL